MVSAAVVALPKVVDDCLSWVEQVVALVEKVSHHEKLFAEENVSDFFFVGAVKDQLSRAEGHTSSPKETLERFFKFIVLFHRA